MDRKQGPFILIVDDSNANLQILGSILRKKDYRVGIAKNGPQALRFANKKPPDLILLDIMMPEMDGFEVCRDLKKEEKTKDIPVIFISALTDTAEKIKGFRSGGVDYITKPFHQEEIFARVDVHLKLKYSQEQLQTANLAKDKFFSIIAHDLRAPVGNLGNGLDLIVKKFGEYEDEKKLRLMNQLRHSAKRVCDLLENLLYWARSQRNEIDYRPENIDLRKIVEENIRLFSGIAKDKSVFLHSEISEDIPAYADADMAMLIVRNLISNALKFTDESGEIRVKAVSGGYFAEVSVADSGVGISKEDMKKLFNFNRHFTTYGTRNEKGSGLGLVLCNEFVRKNGGEIWVRSEDGEGSEFKFTLPGKHHKI